MFTITEEKIHGFNILKIKGEDEGKRTLEAWINPTEGMNICKVIVGEHTVIEWDLERCDKGATYGIPLLYPTPNRVENNKFIFEGKTYPMGMHGMANHAVFMLKECILQEEVTCETGEVREDVKVVGKLDFSKGSRVYKQFPFESSLTICLEIGHDTIRVTYTIENKGEKTLPYGIALHPFFNKLGKSEIKINAKSIMKMTDEKLPTGEILEVRGTGYDLSQYTDVQELNLDHVYTDLAGEIVARIKYPEVELLVEMSNSQEFTHLVVFTPPNQPFFCIENQSCSTNTHNMYAKGYKEISGLEMILPNESKEGYIQYKFKTL
ncbi:MAG: aldose 1-epimerase [Cellulosilyticaceae bacterium]